MRQASRTRQTKETSIEVALLIEGTGTVDVSTGLPFFDHMVSQLGKHAGFDLIVKATGDLEVDAHHTVEDVGILIGETLKTALGRPRRRPAVRLGGRAPRRGPHRGGPGPVGAPVSRL